MKSLIPHHKPPLAPPPIPRFSLLSPAGRCTSPSSSIPPAAPHHPSPTSSSPVLRQVAPSPPHHQEPGDVVVLGTGQIPAKTRLNLCRKLLSAVVEYCSMPSRFSTAAPVSSFLSTSAPHNPAPRRRHVLLLPPPAISHDRNKSAPMVSFFFRRPDFYRSYARDHINLMCNDTLVAGEDEP